MDVGNEDKEMKVEAQISNVGKLVDGSTAYYHRRGGNNKFNFRLYCI